MKEAQAGKTGSTKAKRGTECKLGPAPEENN